MLGRAMRRLQPSDFIERLQLAAHHVQLHVDGRDRRPALLAPLEQGVATVLEMMDAGLAVGVVHGASPFRWR